MINVVDRDLDEWDAEIEAEFQRVVAAGKAAGRPKRGRLVAFPWGFLVDVCRQTEGRAALIVAEYVYRRTKVCNSLTVTLPGSELAELGIDRRRKREALAKLEEAGLVRLEQAGVGRSARVKLTWQPS